MFQVQGPLPAGRHFRGRRRRRAMARRSWPAGCRSRTRTSAPLRYYRMATVQIEAVDAQLPRNPRSRTSRAWATTSPPMLSQLGHQRDDALARAAGDGGPVALRRGGGGAACLRGDAELVASAGRLQDYARAGGTVVVQYGQQEMQTPGLLPYPITLTRLAERVTDEKAPVTVLDPALAAARVPEPDHAAADFNGWVQERATYMPTTADPH